MAKAVKKATKATKIAPPLVKVDTSELKILLVDMEALVQGSGTVDDRQKSVDRLKEIIQKLEA